METRRNTTDIIPWDTLGSKATPNTLHSLAKAIEQVADLEERVEAYNVTISKDAHGHPSLLWLHVTGTINAIAIAERAILTLTL
jgi:hypothetical protein